MADITEASPAPITPGEVIAERYLVGEILGGGGMGVVCAGQHVLLGTPVAIKLIHPELKDNQEAVQRFMNEARTAAALKGEHIARVFDVGVLGSGEPYLVMEQLEGMSLDQYLHEHGPLAQAEAVDIILQTCEGLAEAHAAGLVHRDIKPANLFLARGPGPQTSLKILDFGIAKQLVPQDDPGLTNPGKSLGSPWYMSPEQMLAPASVDARADVWSLGVLLYELLTAKRPFDGETVPQVCATVLTAPSPKPSDSRAGLDPALDEIVLRCLEKEPERRIASVTELARALTAFASGRPLAPILGPDPANADSDRPRPPSDAPSYGSLTPIAAGLDLPALQHRKSLPLLLLVGAALPLLVLAIWIVLRAPVSLAPTAAAPGLGPGPEPPNLLQPLQTGAAVPEPARDIDPTEEKAVRAPVAAEEAPEDKAARERTERAARYAAWLRAQKLKSIKESLPAPETTPEPAPRRDEDASPPPATPDNPYQDPRNELMEPGTESRR